MNNEKRTSNQFFNYLFMKILYLEIDVRVEKRSATSYIDT